MQFFLDSSVRPDAEDTYVRSTPAYLEVQKHFVDPAGISYTYVLQVDRHSFVIASCITSVMDSWIPLLTDRRLGGEYARFLQANMPRTAFYLSNALSSRLSRGALINVGDPDSGDQVWIVATLVGNIDLDGMSTLAELLLHPSFSRAYEVVILGAFEICSEVATKKAPSAGSMVRLFFGSFSRDTMDFGKVAFKNLSTLTDVAATLSGS